MFAPARIQFTPLDSDAVSFCENSNASDLWKINSFVLGVKALGLWDNLLCWPCIDSQNAGSGTTLYSLGGLATANGSMIGGPTWTSSGIAFDGVNDYITTNFDTISTSEIFAGAIGDCPTTGGKGSFIVGYDAHPQYQAWVCPRTSFGGEFRALNSFSSTSDNTTTGVHLWSIIGASGAPPKGYRDTTLIANNGGNITGYAGADPLPSPFVLGRQAGAYQGTAAFFFVIHDAPSTPDDFYNLYKNTLGSSLPLL